MTNGVKWRHCLRHGSRYLRFFSQIAELVFDLIVTHNRKPSFLTLEDMTHVELDQASISVRVKIRGLLVTAKEDVIPEFLSG
jgi:hypothetical protein